MKRFLFLALGVWAIQSYADEVAENTYTVPVDERLKEWGTFVIKDAELRVRRDHNELKLEYTFPDVLIGQKDFKIEATGPLTDLTKPVKLTSQFGEFTCDIVGHKANCKAVYNRKTLPVLLPDGQEPVEAYLETTIANVTELEGRLDTLTAFSHEAAGTFENLKVRYKRRK